MARCVSSRTTWLAMIAMSQLTRSENHTLHSVTVGLDGPDVQPPVASRSG